MYDRFDMLIKKFIEAWQRLSYNKVFTFQIITFQNEPMSTNITHNMFVTVLGIKLSYKTTLSVLTRIEYISVTAELNSFWLLWLYCATTIYDIF